MRKALAVGKKEFRQIVRDRRTLMILLFIPVFFLLLYGYALNFDIRRVALAVGDRDNSVESRALVSAFLNSGYFDFAGSVRSSEDLGRAMDGNVVRAALIIPENTGRLVRRGQPAPVQVIINGDNANTAATVMGYAITIVRSISAGFIVEQRGLNLTPPIAIEPRIWFNPELRSTLFLVPGLIGFIGMITATISTALSVVKEKERGTWEQVRMAPINTVSYVVGKTLPYLLLSQASAFLVIFASMWLFGMPMRGDWLTLFVVVGVFLVGALGTGLFVSTVSDTQQVAFQGSMLIAFLPTFMLSGFIFPIASMPVPLQWVTTIVPAKYFLVALRGVVLKGLSLGEILAPMAALAVFAVAVLALSAIRLVRR